MKKFSCKYKMKPQDKKRCMMLHWLLVLGDCMYLRISVYIPAVLQSALNHVF